MEKEREDNNYPVDELLLCNGAAVFSQRLVNPFSTLSVSSEERCNHSVIQFFLNHKTFLFSRVDYYIIRNQLPSEDKRH
jgi:hypothetical protein